MQVWKDLRVRWMYWRYRHITRNRQRLKARLANRGPRRAPVTPSYRPRGSAAWIVPHRSGRAWVALVVAVVCMAVFRYYADRNGIGRDVTFLVDIAILVAAFVAWRQVTV